LRANAPTSVSPRHARKLAVEAPAGHQHGRTLVQRGSTSRVRRPSLPTDGIRRKSWPNECANSSRRAPPSDGVLLPTARLRAESRHLEPLGAWHRIGRPAPPDPNPTATRPQLVRIRTLSPREQTRSVLIPTSFRLRAAISKTVTHAASTAPRKSLESNTQHRGLPPPSPVRRFPHGRQRRSRKPRRAQSPRAIFSNAAATSGDLSTW